MTSMQTSAEEPGRPAALTLGRQYRSLPGVDVTRLWTLIQQHVLRRYDTIVIHVRSNDLCRSDNFSAVVESLVDLAVYVLSRWTVQKVVISQVFLPWPSTRYLMVFTLAQYNSTVASVNETLRNRRCLQLDSVTFSRLVSQTAVCSATMAFTWTPGASCASWTAYVERCGRQRLSAAEIGWCTQIPALFRATT